MVYVSLVVSLSASVLNIIVIHVEDYIISDNLNSTIKEKMGDVVNA